MKEKTMLLHIEQIKNLCRKINACFDAETQEKIEIKCIGHFSDNIISRELIRNSDGSYRLVYDEAIGTEIELSSEDNGIFEAILSNRATIFSLLENEGYKIVNCYYEKLQHRMSITVRHTADLDSEE